MAGIFWHGATLAAAAGLVTGLALCLWTLFLPSFGIDAVIPARILAERPWGLVALRPRTLFGPTGMDPILHALS